MNSGNYALTHQNRVPLPPMPDERGNLTAEERDQVVKFFEQRGAKPQCPSCGTEEWAFAAYVMELPIFPNDPRAPLRRVYPVVAISCRNCAFLRMHAAVQVGLVPKHQPETTEVPNG